MRNIIIIGALGVAWYITMDIAFSTKSRFRK
jgi:hypothetical protein